MFQTDQLKAIDNQRNSALKTLITTKNKLVECAEKARSYIAKNNLDVDVKNDELYKLRETNNSLESNIVLIEASIAVADKIINPTVGA